MASPVGEESWLAYLEETVRNASDLEQRVNTIELFKRACGDETGSLRIWLAYCNFFYGLYESCYSEQTDWLEEERVMGRELFSFDAALSVYREGYDAVKYRLDDSHLLWDRWISLETEQLAKTGTSDAIIRVTQLYRDRLLTPHLAWDDTSQMFSSFLTEYNKAEWEQSMKNITASAQGTKKILSDREPFELKLKKATRDGDVEAQKAALTEYLEWETLQSRITNRKKDKSDIGRDLCLGLYDRALTGIFSTDEATWLDYIVFLSSLSPEPYKSVTMLDALRRAVHHCSSSGHLWNRYILGAEEAKLDFEEVEDIKVTATAGDQLYKTGMESLLEVYVAWCGFLKRTALQADATADAIDVAGVGLTAALEEVRVVGKRLYGKDFQGDPSFRLERIYIHYLTEKKGSTQTARSVWKTLAKAQIHADSHEFWFQYYLWEMLVWSSGHNSNSSSTADAISPPVLATEVLTRAVNRKSLDWPEKILQVYIQHCNDYELSGTVCQAVDNVHRIEKGIKKRRLREEEEKAAAYAAYYSAQQPEHPVAQGESPSGSKRKRESQVAPENGAEVASKRHKSDLDNVNTGQRNSDLGPKRDRENATVLVTNLPANVTQTKVRQYFKEYGHINSITALVVDEGGEASTALIEFRSIEEARSALLRDGKYFNQSQLSVQPGYDLTVFVTNYPPTADEKYIRELFSDCGGILSVRLPSLKVNTHRRFCYVSFRDREASAKAIQKDGKVVDDGYKLVAKYSDPAHKKQREGSVAEGREIHVTDLDRSASEDEIREVFSKFGKLTRVNVPRNMAGKSKGFAYIDFETKDQAAKAAAEMNNTKFRSQILRVEVSKESKTNPTARIHADRVSASPAPSSRDNEGDEAMQDATKKPTTSEISARSIALMGLPDTVNDARVQALVKPLGEVIRLTLQPSHGSAKIEFVDAAAAGNAALQLNSMEFEGRKLWTGPVDELRHAKAEQTNDRAAYGSKDQKSKSASSSSKPFVPMQSQIRRPGPAKVGPKRGLGFAPRKAAGVKTGEGQAPTTGNTAPKSNADFKAMFLADKGN